MKDIKVDEFGDMVIKSNKIELVTDKEELMQKIRLIIGTNIGEWFLDKEEGIDFRSVLGKNPNKDLIQNNIQSALIQVDENLEIKEFSCTTKDRELEIKFAAINDKGEEIILQEIL